MRIVGGTHRNRTLRAPNSTAVRPSSEALRESLFNICRDSTENAVVLDLFSGSGAIGLEALSRGAKRVTLVDNHRDSIHCIRDNVKTLKVEKESSVILGDVLRILEKLIEKGESYDLIFADPPYLTGPAKGQLYSQKVLDIIDATPSLLKMGGELFIEDANTIVLKTEDLQTLKLKSSRRLGSASLHHFLKI